MAYVASAGTFIGAVLEQAGYEAQARYLQVFQQFFREGGALIYLLAVGGAVFSVAIYGSFRAARYLLLGPAIFWFLVGPTFTYDGVIWKIGGGVARGMNRVRGEGKSRADVAQALRVAKAGDNPGSGQIKVALGFALLARIINEFSRDLVDVMLVDEDGEYLLHISRTRALDYVVNAQAFDPVYMDMFENDAVRGCTMMVSYGLALASRQLRPEAIRAAGGGTDAAQRARKWYVDEFDSYEQKGFTTPNWATKRFLMARGANAETLEKISCKQLWNTIGEYLTQHALGTTLRVLNMAKGDGDNENSACEFLMDKLGKGGGGGSGCQERLQRVVAAFMFKNSVLDRRSGARFVQNIVSNRELEGGLARGTLIPLAKPPAGFEWRNQIGMETTPRTVTAGGWMSIVMNYLGYAGAPPLTQRGAMFRATDPKSNENIALWSPVAELSGIGGPLDASMTELPKYNLKELRQRLFSWSMHLPYWQGVLLYFLASLYPFMALVVLVPGRAHNMLILPLAWFWVKSWDVGLAAVMVFDRVLWNIFPRMGLDEQTMNRPIGSLKMWQVLSDTNKVDATWNLNLHYMLLSMATLSIPAVTGYAILKSRRAVLSSFTDKLVADTKQAGMMLANAYGTQIMQDRVKAMRELGALAHQAAGPLGQRPAHAKDGGGSGDTGGFFKGQGAENARRFALMRALTSLATDETFGGDPAAWSQSQLKAAGVFARTYGKIFELENKHDRAYREAFDPVLGRWSEMRMRMQAFAAAADRSGGFEIDDPKVNAHEQFIDMFAGKFGIMLDSVGDVARRTKSVGVLAFPSFDRSVNEAMAKIEAEAARLEKPEKERAKDKSEPLSPSDFLSPWSKGLSSAVLGKLFGTKDIDGFMADTFHLTPAAIARARGNDDVNGYAAEHVEGIEHKEYDIDGNVISRRRLTPFELRTSFWLVEDNKVGEWFQFDPKSPLYRQREAEMQLFWYNDLRYRYAGGAEPDEIASQKNFAPYDRSRMALYQGFQDQLLKDTTEEIKGLRDRSTYQSMHNSGKALHDYLRQNRGSLDDLRRDGRAKSLYKGYHDAAAAYYGTRTRIDGDGASAGVLTFDRFHHSVYLGDRVEFDPVSQSQPGNTIDDRLQAYGRATVGAVRKQVDLQSDLSWTSPFTLEERRKKIDAAATAVSGTYNQAVEQYKRDLTTLEILRPLHIHERGWAQSRKYIEIGRPVPEKK